MRQDAAPVTADPMDADPVPVMPAESQRSSRTKKKLRKYFRKQNNQQQKKQCAFGYPRIAPSNEEIIIILQLSMIIGLAEKCRARRLPFAFSLFFILLGANERLSPQHLSASLAPSHFIRN